LVDVSGATPKVVLAKGPDLHEGQVLNPALAAMSTVATTGLSSTVVQLGSVRELVLGAASTVFPKLVALTTSPINPSKVAPNNSGPYRNFWINAYDGTKPVEANLLVTTYGARPLPPPVATSTVRFGDLVWLIAASPKSPPAGSYAEASPWVIMGVGPSGGLALAAALEILARRNRHIARLVEERTSELLEAQSTIVRQERLAAVGEVTTMIGHELRNPMGAAINNLFLARVALGDQLSADAERHLAAVEDQVHRAGRLSEDLTAYMREREPQFSEVDFADLVTQVLESSPAPADTSVEVDATATIRVDPLLMIQVLTNLVTNAYQAMPEGGTITLSAQSASTTDIFVEDTGEGIDPGVAERLFDPFVSTKQDGTGLGLAIVRRLVEAQGGTVRMENGATGGARFSISFPSGNGARS
jgi:signal transduction histidine kinase